MAGRVAIVILTFNQRDTTLTCLASLAELGDPPFHALVWDNASTDGTLEAVREAFPHVETHRHVENLGVAAGRNMGARLAIENFSPEYLLFLDNDMTVEPGFVGSLRTPMERDPNVGQTQAKLRFMADRERLNDGGGCEISFILGRTRPVGYGEIDEGQYDTERPCVACGGAMMVRVRVFEELGGFDTAFSPFGPEDLDFSLRLTKAGYTALYVPEAVAYHAVSHTIGADYDAEYARSKMRHWMVFMRRHAPRWKRAVFTTITAPALVIGVILREMGRGNFGAVRGVAGGVADALRGMLGRSSG